MDSRLPNTDSSRQSLISKVKLCFVSPSCARGKKRGGVKKGGGGAGERRVRAGRSPRGKLPQHVGRSRTTSKTSEKSQGNLAGSWILGEALPKGILQIKEILC